MSRMQHMRCVGVKIFEDLENFFVDKDYMIGHALSCIGNEEMTALNEDCVSAFRDAFTRSLPSAPGAMVTASVSQPRSRYTRCSSCLPIEPRVPRSDEALVPDMPCSNSTIAEPWNSS